MFGKNSPCFMYRTLRGVALGSAVRRGLTYHGLSTARDPRGTRCRAESCRTVQYHTIPYDATSSEGLAPCGTKRDSEVQCSAVQCSAAQRSAAQRSAAQNLTTRRKEFRLSLLLPLLARGLRGRGG